MPASRCGLFYLHIRRDLTANDPRPSLHCPKRTIWCGPNQRQALVFAPTHEYLPSAEQWTRHSKMAAACGSTFDFFVNQGTFVYYVGTYKVHSLRSIHPPGSPVPSDIVRLTLQSLSYAAIRHAMGLGAELQTKIRQYFPDGNVKTECFGLQCVGFDHQLYGRLRDRFLAQETRDSASLKRKADSEGPRDGRAKLQRVL
ncbi:hypothetical protein DFH09DRAFT_901919 [Mycena vulgaris]|nr:hypothetical protein DFH09DRAFT_901919 [Mycena vulgaris]